MSSKVWFKDDADGGVDDDWIKKLSPDVDPDGTVIVPLDSSPVTPPVSARMVRAARRMLFTRDNPMGFNQYTGKGGMKLEGHGHSGPGHTHITARQAPKLVEHWADQGRPVQMFGTDIAGHPGLFTRSAKPLARKDMPVVEGDAAHIAEFRGVLRERGLSWRSERVDPATLHATQNELDGAKVGGIERAMRSGKFAPDAQYLVVDRAGNVLDGHHRWAAAATLRVGQPPPTAPVRVKVLRVDTDIDGLLDAGRAYNEKAGVKSKSFGQRAVDGPGAPDPSTAPDPSLPYFWLDGEGWVLLASDTADGVPRDLSGLPLPDQADVDAALADDGTRGDKPGHPFHGNQWKGGTGTGGAPALERRARMGGFTFDPHRSVYPKSGLAVAMPGHSKIIPARKFGREQLDAYLDEHRKTIESNPQAHIGGWYDRKHDEIVLDVVEVFPKNQRAKAISAGRKRNEQAIFDLERLEEIPTGGTGGRSAEGRQGHGGRPSEAGRVVGGVQEADRGRDGRGRAAERLIRGR
jgi:hypothetical protein